MTHDEVRSRQRLLMEALVMLAAEPDEQQRLNQPGCLCCDLTEDFFHALEVARANNDLPDDADSASVLNELSAALSNIPDGDHECFDSSMVRRIAWTAPRSLARRALGLLGWADATVAPFVETSPGVWRRGTP